MTKPSSRRRVCALRIDDAAWRRVSACAARHSITPSEALRQLVLLGLDQAEGMRRGDTALLQEGVDRLQGLLQRMGPIVVGLPHLLAYWATRDLDEPVSADDFVAEFEANAAQLWFEALEKRGSADSEAASSVEPAGLG